MFWSRKTYDICAFKFRIKLQLKLLIKINSRTLTNEDDFMFCFDDLYGAID